VLLRLLTDFDREIDALAKEDRPARKARPARRGADADPWGRALIAMLIVAEVGEVERFPSARHLRAWAGLTPTVRSSDGKARLDHISRLGSSTLRWALDGAANTPRVAVDRLRESLYGIAKRRGRQVAKVAIARKLPTLWCYGLRDGEIRCPNVPDRRSR
jgi:transposase